MRCLTERLVSVSGDVDFIFGNPVFGPSDLFHFEDLGFAEFGVVEEEHPSLQDFQVVFGPVPQLSQVGVVQGVEGIVPERQMMRFYGSTSPMNKSVSVSIHAIINVRVSDTYPASRASPRMTRSLRRKERETRAYALRMLR